MILWLFSSKFIKLADENGEKDNIAKNELEGFKVMAEAFLSLNDEQLTVLIDKQSLVEVFLNE